MEEVGTGKVFLSDRPSFRKSSQPTHVGSQAVAVAVTARCALEHLNMEWTNSLFPKAMLPNKFLPNEMRL